MEHFTDIFACTAPYAIQGEDCISHVARTIQYVVEASYNYQNLKKQDGDGAKA